MGFTRTLSKPAAAARAASPEVSTATSSKVSTEGAHELVAVHERQADIEERHLWLEVARERERGGTVVGDAYLMSLQCEELGQQVGRVLVVVDDQHALAPMAGRTSLGRQRRFILGC